MLIRSGKIQFLFWTAFFSVMLYLWIVTVGLQTFVLPDEKPMHIPQNVVLLMAILFGMWAVAVLAGTIISTMINNRYYTRFFSIFMIVGLGTLVATRSMFGWSNTLASHPQDMWWKLWVLLSHSGSPLPFFLCTVYVIFQDKDLIAHHCSYGSFLAILRGFIIASSI